MCVWGTWGETLVNISILPLHSPLPLLTRFTGAPLTKEGGKSGGGRVGGGWGSRVWGGGEGGWAAGGGVEVRGGQVWVPGRGGGGLGCGDGGEGVLGHGALRSPAYFRFFALPSAFPPPASFRPP